MESNPWADQSDHKNNSPDQITETKKSQGGAMAKIRNGLEKTKEAAANHVKKIVVKEATDASLRWVKDKYHKTTKKHKKEPHDSWNISHITCMENNDVL